MARKRMIDPEFWLDEDLAKLSPYARLLFIGLWGICDDNYATFPVRDGWIKAQVFPFEDVSIHDLLTELSVSAHITTFTAEDDKEYGFINNFFKYQVVNRPSAPKFPQYKPKKDSTLSEDSVRAHPEVKLREENSRKRPSGAGGSPRHAKQKDPQLRNEALDLINYWAAAWEKTFGKKADITAWSRYLKQAMPLVKANSLEAMKGLCDKYFLLFDDKYVKENNWPIGLFLTDNIINKLKNQ